jgi:hypothetical protein
MNNTTEAPNEVMIAENNNGSKTLIMYGLYKSKKTVTQIAKENQNNNC